MLAAPSASPPPAYVPFSETAIPPRQHQRQHQHQHLLLLLLLPLLQHPLPILRQRFPKLRLFLREDLTGRLIAALKAGALDAALIALPYDTAGLETARVADDELLAALPADKR